MVNLRLPSTLAPDASKALEPSYFLGLPDYMPWQTAITVSHGQMTAEKEVPESGCLCVPWTLAPSDNGLRTWPASQPLMLTTATLVERDQSYRLLVELARGKVNQLRNQAADWQTGGLELPPELDDAIREASKAFARSVCEREAADRADELAAAALQFALKTGDELVATYVSQVLAARLARTPKLPAHVSCTVASPIINPDHIRELASSFSLLRLPLPWGQVEATMGEYRWEAFDALLAWAKLVGMPFEIGPLFDMAPNMLPPWLPEVLGDPQRMAGQMLDFLEAALMRYRNDARGWLLTAGSNDPTTLELDDEEALTLNAQLLTSAEQINPTGEYAIALAQPWGEAVAQGYRAISPFVFADALLRSRIRMSYLELEVQVGSAVRGSQPRDRLDLSRLLDLYALLAVPIHVNLGMPSSADADPHAEAAYAVNPGAWDADIQARFADDAGVLVLCKPYVTGLHWSHWCDAHPHVFPHSGLVDAEGQIKPALAMLRSMRQSYLG
ncbi:MAG TPA: hypothetical protein PKD86_10765 [Gemmatales bacterium]|nr:hypothetical protein [Gemmatales bacterium]HMP59826.1 hypothetical protein [Gemmatales bacterium]